MKVIYEDENLIAVEKLPGEFIHPMSGERESKSNNTLFRVRDYLGQQMYLVNRLDRPVSGLVLLGKNPEIIKSMQESWNTNQTQKYYLALCLGQIVEKGIFDSPLRKVDSFQKVDEYQNAITHFDPIQFFENERVTFLKIQIETGRHHQIRRHFRKAVKPLIGDRKHGKGKINNYFLNEYGLTQLFLHSFMLNFIHPLEKKEIKLTCELNQNLNKVIKELNKRNNKKSLH